MAAELVEQTFQDLLLVLGAIALDIAQLLLLSFELAMRTEVRLFR